MRLLNANCNNTYRITNTIVCNLKVNRTLTRDAGPKTTQATGFSRLRREKPARALHRRANRTYQFLTCPDGRERAGPVFPPPGPVGEEETQAQRARARRDKFLTGGGLGPYILRLVMRARMTQKQENIREALIRVGEV